MKNKPINVFLLDDEFPMIDEFRNRGVYKSAISKDDLYHLAVKSEWQHLIDLQQLVIDIITSEACQEGLINLVGFTTPTQALKEIENGLIPDIVIYDWEYPNAPMHSLNSKNWLLEILRKTEAFVFIYSKMRNELPRFLNLSEFAEFSSRFQLFLKGGKFKSSFSAEEFIHQYVIGVAKDRGYIKINGVKIEFASNKYLKSASDILFLQRILGNQFVLDELNKIDFTVNELGVEKILNDSAGYLLFSEKKNVLLNPTNTSNTKELEPLIKLSYAEVLKRFSINILEDTLERGFLVM
ncbi:MAG TPA: hypothetical protein VK590_02220 [Saprospiraceae bacterium]|nr:hypothetical protein [Saprospiraceae bacterium]